MEAGKLRPALIIGGTGGLCECGGKQGAHHRGRCRTPIVSRGRKGGSNVAAAICNAMLYQIRR